MIDRNGWLRIRSPTSPRPTDVPPSICAWIHCPSPSRSFIPNADVAALTRDFQRAVDARQPITTESVLDMAKRCHVTAGKWMLFGSPAVIDDMWEKVARVVLSGRHAVSAKVSPMRGVSKNGLICIYVPDFSDHAHVMRVRDALRELGFTRKIYFKPDAYTYLDLYSGNPYHIKASLYAA